MENLINFIGFLGFICGALRVVPQTYLTIKSKVTKNLSYLYFSMHLFAGCCGFLYECLTHVNIFNLLFFIMIIFTNALQIGYMYYLRVILKTGI